MNIDKAIRLFSVFLNDSWSSITPLLYERLYTTDESSINDWIQANWEILVERKILPINEFLDIYGEGADFNSKSSRITDLLAQPTYYVNVHIEKGTDILNNIEIINEKYRFEKLVGFANGFYTISPPFDYVLIQDEEERVFPLELVKFELVGC